MRAVVILLDRFGPDTFRFYRHALELLQGAGVPVLVGGAYAFGCYTGIVRHTKDFDLFLRPRDVPAALAALSRRYRTEVTFTHWLAKAYHGDDFVDLIFSSGNGCCPVDDDWFRHAPERQVLSRDTRIVPAEEMIWQKAYIMERERFDGADVLHVIRACGRQLDWDRLLARFGPHWRVLFSHLVLFGFVYPDDRDSVPAEVLRRLSDRLHEETPRLAGAPLCRGTLLSRTQYLPETEIEGFADPRLAPAGAMTPEQVGEWTEAGRPPAFPVLCVPR